MADSPTSRTIKQLKKQGVRCGVVERFNQHVGPGGIRIDLFGFIDIIAIGPECGIVGIQASSSDHHANRVKKIIHDCEEQAREWLIAGGKIEVWTWGKRKVKRGGKAVRWTARVEAITLENFSHTHPVTI